MAPQPAGPGTPPNSPPICVLLTDVTHDATRHLLEALAESGTALESVVPDSAALPTRPMFNPSRDVAVAEVSTAAHSAAAVAEVVDAREAGWRRVVALVPATDPADAAAALAAGATGALVSHRPHHRGGSVPSGVYELSGREIEVLRMVADGRSNKWIGEQLELSALTVKSHLARIGRKLGTGERAHMVMLALRAGIIQ